MERADLKRTGQGCSGIALPYTIHADMQSRGRRCNGAAMELPVMVRFSSFENLLCQVEFCRTVQPGTDWWEQRCEKMDTLGFEPRAFRMRSGCDTTTPCAPCKLAARWTSKGVASAPLTSFMQTESWASSQGSGLQRGDPACRGHFPCREITPESSAKQSSLHAQPLC